MTKRKSQLYSNGHIKTIVKDNSEFDLVKQLIRQYNYGEKKVTIP